jgi:FkbM family methyltransferase
MATTGADMAKRAVRKAGLEPLARRALKAAHPNFRRDARDDEHLLLVLAATLTADASAIDIGANHGDVLAEIVRTAPEGRHLAFEALPELAEHVRGRFPGVDVRQLALTDAPGTATFHRAVGAEGYSRLGADGIPDGFAVQDIVVQTGRLDDVVPDGFAPAFIKIDVEGAELFVLRGAIETLRRHRPVLWIEHGRTTDGYRGASSHDLWDLLCGEIGYRLFDADGGGPIPRERFTAGLGGPMMWNWLAR